VTGTKTVPEHRESKPKIVLLNEGPGSAVRAPPALLMNDTCLSIELGSASMPLLLQETLLDESMNRLINQVAV
jgi:hypothetical protein